MYLEGLLRRLGFCYKLVHCVAFEVKGFTWLPTASHYKGREVSVGLWFTWYALGHSLQILILLSFRHLATPFLPTHCDRFTTNRHGFYSVLE
jgi:hypothetical protein